MVYTIETYGYHEDDIFTMTDEKENKGTNRWPSKNNIVGLLLTTCSGLHVSLPGKIKLQFEAMDIFVRNSSSQDKLVFYCELLRRFTFAYSSIFLDAGHCGRDENDGTHGCSCESDFHYF